mgnify:CR=1 FL=1
MGMCLGVDALGKRMRERRLIYGIAARKWVPRGGVDDLGIFPASGGKTLISYRLQHKVFRVFLIGLFSAKFYLV